MGKVVTSTIKRFPGSVTLCDPMTFDVIARWEEALAVIRLSPEENKFEAIERAMYPLVVDMVEAWELKNILTPVTVANFPNAAPGTSASSIHQLTAWLITECQKIYKGDEDSDPNE